MIAYMNNQPQPERDGYLNYPQMLQVLRLRLTAEWPLEKHGSSELLSE